MDPTTGPRPTDRRLAAGACVGFVGGVDRSRRPCPAAPRLTAGCSPNFSAACAVLIPAVVASRIGGIQDQIENGVSGLLIDDPRDLGSYGAAVLSLLKDRSGADRMGRAAREKVLERFLGPRHLTQYFDLMAGLIDGPSA